MAIPYISDRPISANQDVRFLGQPLQSDKTSVGRHIQKLGECCHSVGGGRVGAVRVSWPGALSVVFVFPEVEDLAWLAFLK